MGNAQDLQEYVRMAEQVGQGGAHVAAVMNYRTAAGLAASREELRGVLGALIEYAGRLKKPEDQLAVYSWGKDIIETGLEGDPLETLVKELIGKVKAEQQKGTEEVQNAAA
ncbi:hypothetical protein HYV82_03670 [Candidatus Woesearchaeota archaeon]|nr:hypothetical protein [Candidatus Woesearchaeota archaeon]